MENESYAVQETPNRKGRDREFQQFLSFSLRYQMFALSDAGKDIAGSQEVMHMAVTAGVVMLSIVSLTILIISGCKDKEVRGVGIWAAIALGMMFMGPIGMVAFPPQYFGIFERFSTFAAVGFNAVLGVYLFKGFGETKRE